MKLYIKGTPIAFFNDRFTVCGENGKEVYKAWGEAGLFSRSMRLFDMGNNVIATIAVNPFRPFTCVKIDIGGETITARNRFLPLTRSHMFLVTLKAETASGAVKLSTSRENWVKEEFAGTSASAGVSTTGAKASAFTGVSASRSKSVFMRFYELSAKDTPLMKAEKIDENGVKYALDLEDGANAPLCVCMMFAAHYVEYGVNRADRYHDYSY